MLECFTCLPSEECYLNLPDDLVTDNPLDMENIKEKQVLQQHADKYSDRFLHRQIGTVDDILCYVKPGYPPNNWKIALPKELLQPTIQWFHQVTGHPGSNRLYMQIYNRYYHRDLRSLIDKFHCEHFQRNKLSGKSYSLLPEREIRSIPFEECAVDLIGPWIIQVCKKPYEFNALNIETCGTKLCTSLVINKSLASTLYT